MDSPQREITVIVPINIALIKYWGKRNEDLMTPLNDSLSVTVDGLWAKTKIKATYMEVAEKEAKHEVVVNGKPMTTTGLLNRYERVFNAVQGMIRKGPASEESEESAWVFQISSETNFPVQAGLASSAAGFAAIAYGMGQLFGLEASVVSKVARMGSGSACRSLYPGIVRWYAGELSDGSDCECKPVEAVGDFVEKNLKALILVTSSQTKLVGSTNGMQRSVETSELLQYRASTVVPKRINQLQAAIKNGEFETFAEITMKESNQLHAVCMDTYPPINYLNDASWHLISLVNAYNAKYGGPEKPCAAYTFDAGPNCCLIVKEETVAKMLPYICYHCPPSREKGSAVKFIFGMDEINEALWFNRADFEPLEGVGKMEGAVQYVIYSSLGAGPYVAS